MKNTLNGIFREAMNEANAEAKQMRQIRKTKKGLFICWNSQNKKEFEVLPNFRVLKFSKGDTIYYGSKRLDKWRELTTAEATEYLKDMESYKEKRLLTERMKQKYVEESEE